MHRASQSIRILPAAIFAVAASLALALPVCAQSDEEQRRYEEWKAQQKAEGEVAVGPSATLDPEIAKRVLAKVGKYMSRGVTWGQGTLTGEQMAVSRGTKPANPAYSNLKKNKAITVCVAWESSTIDFLNIRVYGGAHYKRHIGSARESSLWQCEKFKARGNVSNCDCRVLIENNSLVLKVPKSFLTRISTNLRPVIPEVAAVPFIGAKGKAVYNLFLDVKSNKAFAISADGTWGARWNSWVPIEEIKRQALKDCQKRASKPCLLYAVNDEVVWKDP